MLTHATLRSLRLGEHAWLLFEDLSVAGHAPPSRDGRSLKATLRLEYAASARHPFELARLAGIERRVYGEVEGLGRSFAIADKDMGRSEDPKSAADHVLRFEFSPEQILAIRAGADFGFGIDDDRMRVGAKLKSAQCKALLADFD